MCIWVAIAKLGIPRSAFLLTTDGAPFVPQFAIAPSFFSVFLPDYKSYFYPNLSNISTWLRSHFYTNTNIFFQQRVRHWWRLQLKGLNPSSKSKYGRLNLRDSWICEKTNWYLWKKEKDGFVICRIKIWQNMQWTVAPDVKFTQTDFLVQNSSPPLMIVNFLFCDAYFHKKVLVNGQLFVTISWPKPLLLEQHLLQIGNPDQLKWAGQTWFIPLFVCLFQHQLILVGVVTATALLVVSIILLWIISIYMFKCLEYKSNLWMIF